MAVTRKRRKPRRAPARRELVTKKDRELLPTWLDREVRRVVSQVRRDGYRVLDPVNDQPDEWVKFKGLKILQRRSCVDYLVRYGWPFARIADLMGCTVRVIQVDWEWLEDAYIRGIEPDFMVRRTVRFISEMDNCVERARDQEFHTRDPSVQLAARRQVADFSRLVFQQITNMGLLSQLKKFLEARQGQDPELALLDPGNKLTFLGALTSQADLTDAELVPESSEIKKGVEE